MRSEVNTRKKTLLEMKGCGPIINHRNKRSILTSMIKDKQENSFNTEKSEGQMKETLQNGFIRRHYSLLRSEPLPRIQKILNKNC